MKFKFWNASNVRYSTLEKLKPNSILDSVTTKRMYGNQMIYMQAVTFHAKAITSTHMKNSYCLNRYAKSTSRKKNWGKVKTKIKLLDINTRKTKV